MNLYEIAAPVMTNDGQPYDAGHVNFSGALLSIAGGFTCFPDAQGCWRDDAGKMYAESMTPYRVACEPAELEDIIAEWWRCFPDQKAVFVAQIGTAEIRSKPGDEDHVRP